MHFLFEKKRFLYKIIMAVRPAPPLAALVISDLEEYLFERVDTYEDVVFQTEHGSYGPVEWCLDTNADMRMLWSSHERWYLADSTCDVESHVARMDVQVGVNFDDEAAPIVVTLDFVEAPLRDADVVQHVCMAVRSAEEWALFKAEHIDVMFERAEELAKQLCSDWSSEDTDV